MNEEQTSEFGKGFVYNLILFAEHFGRNTGSEKDIQYIKDYGVGLWFNASSDHLHDLEIPDQWKDHEIGKKAKELQDFALDIGHGSRMMEKVKVEEREKVQRLTKDLGLLIDKELGLEPIKGQWE